MWIYGYKSIIGNCIQQASNASCYLLYICQESKQSCILKLNDFLFVCLFVCLFICPELIEELAESELCILLSRQQQQIMTTCC